MTATASATAPAGVQRRPLLGHRQIMTILAGLMAGMFLAALDQTIVATSIRTIADDLSGLSLQAWVTTAYLITSTLTTPLYGKMSDLYGRKPLFLFAIGVFVLGSIACTFSESMYQLAAFRAVQGIGAGGLFSLALTIIGDIVSPRERARYQGYFVAVFATASVLGPLAGGFLAGQASIIGITGWRWVFLVNVPIGVIALLVVAKVLNLPHAKRRREDRQRNGRRHGRVDWPGAIRSRITRQSPSRGPKTSRTCTPGPSQRQGPSSKPRSGAGRLGSVDVERCADSITGDGASRRAMTSSSALASNGVGSRVLRTWPPTA